MAKFKIVDRVRVVCTGYDDHAEKGGIGTVLEDSAMPWIVFDNPTYHSGGEGIEGWKFRHMDCLCEYQLEPYVSIEEEQERMQKFWTDELTLRSVSVPGWGKTEDGNYLAESARSYWKAWKVARNEVNS